MHTTGKFFLVFLCLTIASYGLSGSVYASNHNVLPFTVATNSDSYSAGDTILIFGAIRDYDGKYPNVTIQVFGPLGGMKIIDQLTAKSDGTFSVTKKAQGTINLTGEYTVKAMWNKQPAETTFEFVGGAEPEPIDTTAVDLAAAEKAAAEKAAAEKAAAEKAAALPMSISIENAIGSSTPGCEPECFIPNAATVAVGGTVSFVNSDTAPHTSTSGTPADGPDGVWDSSLVMPGSSYDTTISSAGTYDYFCMVHPWMTGTITAK